MKKLRTIADIKTLDDYDFLDLGAGDGGSIKYCEIKIGGKGLGIELDKTKVRRAQDQGMSVVLGNALDLKKIPGKVDYVVCDNFLEHLYTKDEVQKIIKIVTKVTRKFIYISHPSFEDIDYLKAKGLKTYWTDWESHRTVLTLSDIIEIFSRYGINWVQIKPIYKIQDSDDPRILPLNAKIDQASYEPKHGKKPKPAIKFDRDMYYSFDIIGLMPGASIDLPIMEHKDPTNTQKHPVIGNWQRKI